MNKWNFKKYFFCAFVEKMTCIASVREIREVVLLVKAISHILSLTYHMISYYFFIYKIK